MKRRLSIWLVIGLMLLLASLLYWGFRPREIYYQGKSLKAWARQLDSDQPASRASAETAIKTLGPRAVPRLVRMLQAQDALWRRLAWRLSERLPRSWRPTLLKRAGLPEAHLTREAAARGLALLGPEAQSALPKLLAALRDPDMEARMTAAQAAARVGGKAAVPGLIRALNAPDSAVRQAAAKGVGEVGPDAGEAIPALALALNDTRARSMAVFGLCHIGAPAGRAMIEVCRHGEDKARAAAARVLGGLLRSAVQTDMLAVLIAALRDPSEETRVEAAQALSLSGTTVRTAAPGLAACLADPSPAVRATAAQALGAIGPSAREAVPELMRLAEDKDPSVRAAAKAALARIGR